MNPESNPTKPKPPIQYVNIDEIEVPDWYRWYCEPEPEALESPAGIYQVLHVPSLARYLGSSVSIYRRWAEHRKRLSEGKASNPTWQKFWNESKDTDADFRWSIIEEIKLGPNVCIRDLRAAELKMIDREARSGTQLMNKLTKVQYQAQKDAARRLLQSSPPVAPRSPVLALDERPEPQPKTRAKAKSKPRA
jgi:hypothetical protein